MTPNAVDRRSVALGSVLIVSALVALVISAAVAPIGSLIALPIGDGSSTTAGIIFFTVLALAASVVTAESPAGFVLVAVTAPICAAAALGAPSDASSSAGSPGTAWPATTGCWPSRQPRLASPRRSAVPASQPRSAT